MVRYYYYYRVVNITNGHPLTASGCGEEDDRWTDFFRANVRNCVMYREM